ncbi:hypothetical protein [Enterovibrio norvegicus]|uniref:hypothetical protein n=1 Tax=Enterovibrio norvegicus TaxID=188144 RepID=UPI001FD5CCB4|nr:hypothetical protein [Enterovibrio norvegicus]
MADIVVCHGAILLRSETLIGHRFAVTDKVLSFLSAGNVTSAIMHVKTKTKTKTKTEGMAKAKIMAKTKTAGKK